MSAPTLDRPTAAPTRPRRPSDAPPPSKPRDRWGLEIAVTLLLVAASLSLGRVYVGLGFLRPVVASVLLSVGVAAGARRLGAGPILAWLASAVAWLVFAAVAFVPETLVAFLVPTPDTFGALAETWMRGLDLLRLRPAPAFPEPGLMLITVTGVWWVAHGVEGLVFRLGAPVRAVLMAMVLWTVPLSLAPQGVEGWGGGGWPWVVPFLAAAAVLLLAFAGSDLRRWGAWVDPWTGRRVGARRGLAGNPLAPAGALVAVVAIVAGVLLGASVPGADSPPWWQLRGLGGTTLTTNPIVNIRTNLVAQGSEPVLRVRTPRPVYLRTTALDVYSENEEWTSSGIRGATVPRGFVPSEVPIGPADRFWMDVEVLDLPGAVLVPAPYQPEAFDGPLADDLRYDRSNATVTLAQGETLEEGDAYAIAAAVPNPSADQLDATPVFDPTGELTALPANLPEEVGALARQVVAAAGADTPFQQALAVQDELRSWEYSLDPPQGHSGEAMRTFLENRVGYCEQFAGTMAVMLRTLGIPARVAVGYSPGDLVDPAAGEYVIANANAHAWVEVLFPGMGWIAFEPTPRDDGNVLVPSATNLAPARTAASASSAAPTSPGMGDFPTGSTGADSTQAQAEAQQDAAAPDPAAGGDAPASGAAPIVVAVVALLVAAAVVVALAAGRRRGAVGASTGARVDTALAEVTRVGRGLGVVPAAWETEREYLSRLAPHDADADALATAVAQGRYAATVPDGVATEAEEASRALTGRLLDGRSAAGRRLVLARGRLRSAPAVGLLPGRRLPRPARRRGRRVRTAG